MIASPVQPPSAVSAVADRFPALLADLRDHVTRDPSSARFQAPPRSHRTIDRPTHLTLLNVSDPAAVLDACERSAKPVVHCLPYAWQFLHFLGNEHAAAPVAHSNYTPLVLLPLQFSGHLQSWLGSLPPETWPWEFGEPGHFDDPRQSELASQFFRQMLALLANRQEQLRDDVARQYEGSTSPADVLRAGSRPLRTLVVAFQGSAYQQFCARDITAGLQEIGIDARACIVSTSPSQGIEILRAVQEFSPDLLFANGRGRESFPLLPRNLGILSWDQDHVLCSDRTFAGKMAPRDRLILMLEDWLEDARLGGVPPDRVAYINLGTNTSLYAPRAEFSASPKTDDHDEADVEGRILFVGNYHPFDTYRRIIGFEKLPGELQRIMLRARDRLAEWIDARQADEPFIIPDCDELLESSAAEIGLRFNGSVADRLLVTRYFRYRIAHLLVREKYLVALADLRPAVFGRGWEHLPALAGLARPEVENGPRLRELIHRAAINLHLHTWTVHHPRLYDTAAAGGFLLVGRVPEKNPLSSVFVPRSAPDSVAELDDFGSIPELRRKIRFYLSRPELRREMSRRAVERVAREHPMSARMRQVRAFLARG
jgi:hypothetical protein